MANIGEFVNTFKSVFTLKPREFTNAVSLPAWGVNSVAVSGLGEDVL